MTRAHFFPLVGAGILLCSLAAIPWTGCKPTGVGDPCIPEQEYQQNFAGFTPDEVSTESESFQCETRLCFVNHFQGRVSCPYGQLADGGPPAAGADPCYVPNSQPKGSSILTGNAAASDDITPNDPTNGNAVNPQCLTRLAQDTVFCSCRCANIDGQTNDGENYCTCPSGFSCQSGGGYVSSIGVSSGIADQELTGYYCAKDNTVYDPDKDCLAGFLCSTTGGPNNTPNCEGDNQWQQP